MISRAVALLLVVGLIVGSDGSICPPATWLAEGSDYTCTNATNGVLYDGSRIPDCSGDEGTTHLHVHEYDCGLFWECGPSGACLMECPICFTNPITCPVGRLEFDCRSSVCDFSHLVDCNNCKEECESNNCSEGWDCDRTTDCKCSDCKSDSDCASGQQCCDRKCASSCGKYTCPEINIDFAGHDITVIFDIFSWEECAALCLDMPDCLFWTLDNRDGEHRCIPKTSDAGYRHLADHISGVRGCLE